MSYFRPCPKCGANLDPGEICDCTEKAASGAGTSDDGTGKISTNIITTIFDFVKE